MKFGGFIEDIINSVDLINYDILQADHNWLPYLPAPESQKNAFCDSQSCVTFGTLNVVEILDRKIWNKQSQYSDRFTAIESGTGVNGNTPSSVNKSVAYSGLLDESLLPFDETIKTRDDFFKLPESSNELLKTAYQWSQDYRFEAAYIFTPFGIGDRVELIKWALKSSPVGISVFAWSQNPETKMYIKPMQFMDNHFVCIVDYKEGVSWTVFDSYENNIKYLDWNYPFTYALRYRLTKWDKTIKKQSWLDKLFNFF